MIEMLPIQFLFASVDPVVVMRLRGRTNGKEYPPSVPHHSTAALELEAVLLTNSIFFLFHIILVQSIL